MARPEVIVESIIVLVRLDVVRHSAYSCLYLPLQGLSEPSVIDVVREFWCMYNFDHVSVIPGDVQKGTTLVLDAKCSIVQFLRRRMREDVGQITCKNFRVFRSPPTLAEVELPARSASDVHDASASPFPIKIASLFQSIPKKNGMKSTRNPAWTQSAGALNKMRNRKYETYIKSQVWYPSCFDLI